MPTTFSSFGNGCLNDLKKSQEKEAYDQKPLNGRFVAKLLNDLFGIQARGGCACAGPYGHHLLHVDKASSLAFRSSIQKGYEGAKPAWTRISFPYYMSNEELEFVLQAVELVAVFGHRFLPYYDLDWRNGDWRFNEKAFREGFQRVTEDNNSSAVSNNHDLPKLASFMQQLKLSYNRHSDLNSFTESPIKPAWVQFEDDHKEEKHTTSVNLTNNNIDDKDKSVTRNKYRAYLEAAVYTACLLSNFPEQPKTEIPPGILLDLPFKI